MKRIYKMNKLNKFGLPINSQISPIGKPSVQTQNLETATKRLDTIQKANRRAEKIMTIIASSAERGTYNTCEKANQLIQDCYDYAYSLYKVDE